MICPTMLLSKPIRRLLNVSKSRVKFFNLESLSSLRQSSTILIDELWEIQLLVVSCQYLSEVVAVGEVGLEAGDPLGELELLVEPG